jgi:hypothetical protein
VPLVLPYLQALQTSQGRLGLSHRTFRSADDLAYWIRRIPKDERAFVYVACHARDGELYPVDGRKRVPWDDMLDALGQAKSGAIEFIHFGACEILQVPSRRKDLEQIASACKARWVSGYE